MRWNTGNAERYIVGEVVSFEKFLLLPKCIGGEWRWLCIGCWCARVAKPHPFIPLASYDNYWTDERWLD